MHLNMKILKPGVKKSWHRVTAVIGKDDIQGRRCVHSTLSAHTVVAG